MFYKQQGVPGAMTVGRASHKHHCSRNLERRKSLEIFVKFVLLSYKWLPNLLKAFNHSGSLDKLSQIFYVTLFSLVSIQAKDEDTPVFSRCVEGSEDVAPMQNVTRITSGITLSQYYIEGWGFD